MLQTRALYAEQLAAKPYYNPANRFKAQKIWPPDLARLTPKQQLRFERKYKRRCHLACSRPKFTKRVHLANWIICSGMRAQDQVRRPPPRLTYSD